MLRLDLKGRSTHDRIEQTSNKGQKSMKHSIVFLLLSTTMVACSNGIQQEPRSEVVYESDLLTFYDVPEDTLDWMNHCLYVKADSVISMFAFTISKYEFKEDTLLFHLIGKLVERDVYEGNLKAVYKWFWHDAIEKDVEEYLVAANGGQTMADSASCECVMRTICDSIAHIDTYEDIELNALASIEAYVACWRMIDKYKCIIKSTDSIDLKRTYLEDCQAVLKQMSDERERQRNSGINWGRKANLRMKQLAEDKIKMLYGKEN